MKRRRRRGREGEAKEGENKRKIKSRRRRRKKKKATNSANFFGLRPIVVLAAPGPQDSPHQRSRTQSASKVAAKSDKRVPSLQGPFPWGGGE